MQHRIAEEQGDADCSMEVATRIMDQYRERIDGSADDAGAPLAPSARNDAGARAA